MLLRRPRRLGLLTGALVVAVGLSSCGGSDDPVASDGPLATRADGSETSGSTTDRDAFVAAAAADMSVDGDLGTCLTGAVVDAVGIEELVAVGVSPTEFARASSLEEMGVSTTLDDPDALQAELAGCGDLVGIFATGNDDEHEQACVEASLTNDLAAEMIVGDLTGVDPSAEVAAAREEIATCILDAVGATATT